MKQHQAVRGGRPYWRVLSTKLYLLVKLLRVGLGPGYLEGEQCDVVLQAVPEGRQQ